MQYHSCRPPTSTDLRPRSAIPRCGNLAANAQEPSGHTVVGASCVSALCKYMYAGCTRILEVRRLDRELGVEIDVQNNRSVSFAIIHPLAREQKKQQNNASREQNPSVYPKYQQTPIIADHHHPVDHDASTIHPDQATNAASRSSHPAC